MNVKTTSFVGNARSRPVALARLTRNKAWGESDLTETLLDSILDNVPTMVVVKDAEELRFVRINRAGEVLLGCPASELIGKTDHALYPKHEADASIARDREVLEGDAAVEISEEPIRTRSGRLCLVRTKKIPVVDQDGRPRYLLAISEDLGARKRTVEELERESRRIQLLQVIAAASNEARGVDEAMQTAVDAVCAHAHWPVGHVYMVTEGVSGELEPTSIWHDDDPERYIRFRRTTEVVRLGVGVGLPGRVLQTGAPVWAADLRREPAMPRSAVAIEVGLNIGFAFPVRIGKQVAAVLEFFSAASSGPDQRLLETMAHVGAQLGRLIERKRTEDLERSFGAIVSHDLKNPLFGIMVRLANLSADPNLPMDQAGNVAAMINSATRIQRIVRDLLDYNSHQHGAGIPIKPAPADFDAICREIVVELETCYGDRSIEYSTSGDGRGLWDATRMAQVIQNLLANALAYSPEGAAVQMGWVAIGDRLTLEVHNSGEPIPPEVLPEVFTPFRRGKGEQEARRSSGSIGIGLFIVDQIVRALGGTVQVRSTASEGTTFTVRVPLVPDR